MPQNKEVLGQMITNMFRNLMDQIVLAIYEGSDGRFFKESAGEAYIRAGRFNEARAMNDKGVSVWGHRGTRRSSRRCWFI